MKPFFTRRIRGASSHPKLWWLVLLFGLMVRVLGQETLPPLPPKYFNDTARIVPAAAASELNEKLAEFERTSSSQLVVAIYPRLPPRTTLEDYANRLFRHWKIGEAKKNNGVLLLVFSQDRKLRIEVGYGLEGALPDAVAKRIIENEITPQFRAGNFAGGITAGVNAIMAATKGEYRGVGTTVAQRAAGRGNRPVAALAVGGFLLFWILVFAAIAAAVARAIRRGTVYGSRGARTWYDSGGWSTWSGAGGGSSNDSSSSSSSFSGGGGDSGGGGASGGW